MNKTIIEVPTNVRFLSDWGEFNLSKFPGKCIINKQIPGCGFTEYCIRSSEDIILCSPRKILLKNKFDQHRNEVYLVVNELDKDPGVDRDISKVRRDSSPFMTDEERNRVEEEFRLEMEAKNKITYSRIYREIEQYIDYRRSQMFKPLKILVTYDSYHIVVDILNKLGIYDRFYTVIDEFQSILHDARFKSDTELGFLNTLQQFSPTALFVSATPMMEEYLDMLDSFKNLPYFEMDWHSQNPNRVIKPSLKILTMKSANSKAREVIDSYLQGNLESLVVMRSGKPVRIVSNEAVLYVNSVNLIISVIKKSELKPEQCNILCADTEENRSKIKKRLGKGFDIGSIPLRGVKPKMFTFCTRTVYLGADFYSDCARSFIFSDSNSDCLAVDISEDLPQILGRQRLFENPWKNSATFYYRATADYRKMEWKDFERKINKKRVTTDNLLRAFIDSNNDSIKYSLAEKYQKDAKLSHYKDDYVSVNRVRSSSGVVELVPVINELVLVNELRAFKIQQIDYADRFAVFSTVHNNLTPDDIVNQEAYKFLEKYNSMTEANKKLKFLCESSISGTISPEVVEIILGQIPDDDYIKSYYLALGPQKLKNLGYKRANIENALNIVVFSDNTLLNSIYSNFKIGDRYLLSDLKQKLGSIYSSINYESTPKARDIEKWFDVKESTTRVTLSGEKKVMRYYELIGSKEFKLRADLCVNQG